MIPFQILTSALLCMTVLTRVSANESDIAREFENFKVDILQQMRLLTDKVIELEMINSEQTANIRQQDLKMAEQDLKLAEQEKELKRLSNEILILTGGRKSSENDSSQTKESTISTITKANLSVAPVKRRSFFRRQNPSQEPVSFFAELSTSLSNLTPDHDIHFDKVLTNNGGGYKNFSGTFVTPSGGVYVFMWSVTGRGNIPMQLTVNGVVRGRFDPYTGTHDAINTASGFVVLNINAGDIVLIRTHPTFLPTGTIRNDEWIQSTFGGWKIIKDCCSEN